MCSVQCTLEKQCTANHVIIRGLTTPLASCMFVHVFKSTCKQQLGCRFDIMDCNFLYFDICSCICPNTSYYFSALSLHLEYCSLMLSSTPVLTFSIDAVFILSIDSKYKYPGTDLFCLNTNANQRTQYTSELMRIGNDMARIDYLTCYIMWTLVSHCYLYRLCQIEKKDIVIICL